MQKLISSYDKNGIDVYLQNDGIIKSAKIVYEGLLPNSGATDVYAHVGYATHSDYGNTTHKWSDVKDVKMRKISEKTFEAVLPVDRNEDTLCLAFKDCAQHWDNNSGNDYMVTLR